MLCLAVPAISMPSAQLFAVYPADVNSGLNSREAIEYYDPPLAAILAWTFGRGSWRYPHSMPKPFAKGPPGRWAASRILCSSSEAWQADSAC